MGVCFVHSFLIMNSCDLSISTMDLYRTAVEIAELSSSHSTDEIKSSLSDYLSKIIVDF